ncbi:MULTISPECIES: DeoR/GlpR family DNA-binding transcription regulator [unclassified Cryobacterium]|uniref:DeoR/GlpR family DNA-binding transcription regulator n=1 Tax=unclassified Cryobacterium TaxID=2649013 RepID=UPI001E36FAA9|nr:MULTISPECIES: DeoR/GlpR family DNA-binding transcription regulator [unclassified Cryobacterium]
MSKLRQSIILKMVEEAGYQQVGALASALGVDASTIRRDLEKLEKLGTIERSHGGASLPEPASRQDVPFSVKERQHGTEKSAIGAAMAERIGDGQTVLLDSGSTTLEVARHLSNRSGLTLITNDLRIGLEIATHKHAHVVVLGGELLPNVYTLWGDNAVTQLKKLKVDVAVFGADAVNANGITNTNGYELELKQTMLSIATSAFLVADSSKFERQALFRVFSLAQMTAGITDDLFDPIVAANYPVPIIRVPVTRTLL